METRNSSRSTSTSATPINEGATSTQKEKLLREIEELKSIIKQCEWSLDTPRFKDVEERVSKSQSSKIAPQQYNRIPNVEVDLQYDLYRFAGLYCSKFRRQEYIFNFASMKEQQKDNNTQALQIFLKDGKANLGKWVMPMSIDMNHILSKTPIDDLKNLTSFVKNCKHNVDCYVVREEQFLSLQKRLANMKHCALQSSIGYMQISLELYGVHDSEDDKYINPVIYLMYHSDEARPYKIEVDTTDKKRLSDDLRQRLKTSLKEFRISDLQTAFDKVLMGDSSAFMWIQADDSHSDSPMELNDTSNSEEEDFLAQVQSNRKKLLRKTKKKRELQKKWNERKKRTAPLKNVTSDEEDDKEESHSKTKVFRVESPRRIPAKKNKTSTSRQPKKIDKKLPEDTTPLMNPKVRLKQTKLNFQISQTTNSDSTSLFPAKLRNKNNTNRLKTAKLITSTPKNIRLSEMPSSSGLEIDITPMHCIEPSRQIANKLDDSNKSNKLRKSDRLKDSKNTNKKNDSEESNKSNDSTNSNESNNFRRSDRLKNSTSANNMNDSSDSNQLKNSKNSNKLNDSKSTTKLKGPKHNNLPENDTSEKQTHRSLQNKNKSAVRSTLRPRVSYRTLQKQISISRKVQKKAKKKIK